MSEQLHHSRLQCVCGNTLKHSKTAYGIGLMAVFHIDTTPVVHPGQLCEKCKTVLSESLKAMAEGRVYRHSMEVHE